MEITDSPALAMDALRELPADASVLGKPHVVIVGAGFAGLRAAKTLRNADVDITIVDRHNHHLFQPLLYQVATAGLNTSDIAQPIRRILRNQKNVRVLLSEVKSIDLTHDLVQHEYGELSFDHLIVATGATHSYFGHPEWSELAPGLKSLEDAVEIRRRVLLAFEKAEQATTELERSHYMTFVVVGAGPTGVELAGALAEISRFTLERDFRQVDPRRARVLLVEAGARVLSTYPEELSHSAAEQLARVGVEVLTHSPVTHIDERGVVIGDERVSAATVLWGAGVAASPLAKTFAEHLDRAGRVRVTPTLTLPGRDDVYVVGDLAALEQDGKPVPGVAPAAMQQGKHAADNILRSLRGEPLVPFRYVDKGSLATIGRGAAIADLGKVKLSGALAWIMWLLVHIAFLIGFRNRVLVLFEWAWSYFTYDRGARVIVGDTHLQGDTPAPRLRAGRQEDAGQDPRHDPVEDDEVAPQPKSRPRDSQVPVQRTQGSSRGS